MLPGFRFLFAAILLSVSILVFGLGAAALLRAAHEEFASTPSWHPASETVFAQQQPSEGPRPVLAMLRLDAPAAEQKAPEDVPAAAAPAEPAATAPTPAEPEASAALTVEDATLTETVKPEFPVEAPPAQGETASAQDQAAAALADVPPASADSTRIAAAEETASPANAPPANEAVAAAPEQASPPASPNAGATSTKVATLAPPPIIKAQTPARAAAAKPDKNAIKKRLQEERQAILRRRKALRARMARQTSQQFNLFAQPTAH
jgi:hypothetical protein